MLMGCLAHRSAHLWPSIQPPSTKSEMFGPHVCIVFLPGFFIASSKCHPWSLKWRWWFLREVLVAFDIEDFAQIHKGSYMSIFRYLPTWKVVQLLGFSRASLKYHPWSLKRHWWFLSGVLVVSDILDVAYIHPGRSVSMFRVLAAWEMPNLLCVSRQSSWSLWGRWWFLRGVLVVFDITDVSKTC